MDDKDCTYNRSLIHFIRIPLLICLAFLGLVSCSKDDCNCGSSSPETAEYYVRYELETGFIGTTRDMTVSILNDKGQTLTYDISTGQDMEVVVGPVQFGYTAEIEVNVSQYTAHLNPMIFVSKNNSPFALKAIDDVTAGTVSLTYTIDF